MSWTAADVGRESRRLVTAPPSAPSLPSLAASTCLCSQRLQSAPTHPSVLGSSSAFLPFPLVPPPSPLGQSVDPLSTRPRPGCPRALLLQGRQARPKRLRLPQQPPSTAPVRRRLPWHPSTSARLKLATSARTTPAAPSASTCVPLCHCCSSACPVSELTSTPSVPLATCRPADQPPPPPDRTRRSTRCTPRSTSARRVTVLLLAVP